MPELSALTWDEAVRRGHRAVTASEVAYDEIDADEGRSNIDIEKHLRRAEIKAAQASAWFLLAAELRAGRELHATRERSA